MKLVDMAASGFVRPTSRVYRLTETEEHKLNFSQWEIQYKSVEKVSCLARTFFILISVLSFGFALLSEDIKERVLEGRVTTYFYLPKKSSDLDAPPELGHRSPTGQFRPEDSKIPSDFGGLRGSPVAPIGPTMPMAVSVEEKQRIIGVMRAQDAELTRAQERKLHEIFDRNPALTRAISEALPRDVGPQDDDFFLFLVGPVGQLFNALYQGVTAPAAQFCQLPNGGELHVGGLPDGLNPDPRVRVVFNFSERSALETMEYRGSRIEQYTAYRSRPEMFVHDVDDRTEHEAIETTRNGLRDAVQTTIIEMSRNGRVVLGHCTEGKNRTGVWASVVDAFFRGTSFDDAFERFLAQRGRRLHSNPHEILRQIGRDLLQELNGNPEFAEDRLQAVSRGR